MPSQHKLAIALSGGKDSMGMVIALKDFQNIVAITVDHRLRPTSTQEALQVQKWMMALNIPHVILTWEHDGIDTDIQNKARIARYDLMTTWCLTHNVPYLITAHHLEDQVETFFMRLSKGSGLKGLGAIHEVTRYNNITILRPFLTLPQTVLHTYSQNHPFIDDPSNYNPIFERVKFRELTKHYLTLDPHAHILKTITKLQETDRYLDDQIQHISYHQLLELDYVLFERVIHRMFQDQYPFKSKKVRILYDRLKDPHVHITTFAHHIFKKTKEGIEIVKEDREPSRHPGAI